VSAKCGADDEDAEPFMLYGGNAEGAGYTKQRTACMEHSALGHFAALTQLFQRGLELHLRQTLCYFG